MTRPMPGPPEHWDWDGLRLRYEAAPGRLNIVPDWWFRQPENSKHLTTAETAAHYWRAKADEMVHLSTWHRFDTRPHALEGGTA